MCKNGTRQTLQSSPWKWGPVSKGKETNGFSPMSKRNPIVGKCVEETV